MEVEQIPGNNFDEVASEKIIRVLCTSREPNIRKWAVKFLQRAARGFGSSEHEPWIGALNILQCCEVILSNYKSHIRKPDLDIKDIVTTFPLLLKSPLYINTFISELATLFITQYDVLNDETLTIEKLNHKIFVKGSDSSNLENKDIVENIKLYSENSDAANNQDVITNTSNGQISRKKGNISNSTLSMNESIIKFFHDVWVWTANGTINLESSILGQLLTFLPICVEGIMVDMALKVMERYTNNDAQFIREETIPEYGSNVAMIVDILEDSDKFVNAVATSPKLFQMCSSILNQLLIQSAGCFCSWSPMLSLSTSFAKETAKGRAEFYPMPMQATVISLGIAPQTVNLENYKKYVIFYSLKTIINNQPAEAVAAVLSHFPEWLPYIDPILFVSRE